MFMTHDEFVRGLRIVVPITLATLACGYVVITGVLMFIGFQDARLHYTLVTVFSSLMTPVTVFPLVVMAQRLRRAKAELEALLRIDTLTELPNRRAFFEQADVIFANGNSAALMMVDIDHFKSVNDRFGHEVGDGVLRAVAKSLQQIVEAAAGCNGRKIAARIGGEEFAIVVEGMGGEAAGRLATEIVEWIGAFPVCASGHAIPVTVSIGLAERRAGEGADAVLRAADNACYRAKRLGRNQWCADAGLADCPSPRLVPEPEADSSGAIRLRARNA
jgi:diguanylate cyclase (GGDEF)-like protein